VTGLDLARPEAVPFALGAWLLAATGVALAIRVARNRSRKLLGPRAPGGRLGRDACMLSALGIVAIGAVGPRCGTETVRVPASGVDVVVLFDVSRSMLARDVAPNRLSRARRAADELLADLTEADRAALAVFAGHGVLLTPLTPDKEALRALVPAIEPSLMAAGGSDLEQGISAAVRAFELADARPRVVVVLGDGEDPSRSDDVGLEAAARAGARAIVATFGTEAGAPVPAQTGTLQDAHGRPVVSRAHPERMGELANGTGGVLVRTDSSGRLNRDELLAAVRRDAPRSGAGFIERRLPVVRSDLCALVALVLLLAEAARALPVWGRLSSPALVAAAGVLLVGAAAAPDPPSEEAGDLLREGVARAEQGRLEEAEHAFFAALTRTRDPAVAADAYYDLGVAALSRRDYEAARAAFFDSLALRPGDRKTQFNLEWTMIALSAQSKLPTNPAGQGEEGDPESSEEDAGDGRPDPTSDESENPKAEDDSDESEAESESQPGDESPTGERETARSDGGSPSNRSPRRNPVELDRESAEKWLDAVEDDPQRSLRAATRGAADPNRRSSGPRW